VASLLRVNNFLGRRRRAVASLLCGLLGQLGGVGFYKRTRRPLSMRRCIAVTMPIYRLSRVGPLPVFKIKVTNRTNR